MTLVIQLRFFATVHYHAGYDEIDIIKGDRETNNQAKAQSPNNFFIAESENA